jgi:hypothetical protein
MHSSYVDMLQTPIHIIDLDLEIMALENHYAQENAKANDRKK